VYDAARRAAPTISGPNERGQDGAEYYEVQAQSEVAYLIHVHAMSCSACRFEGATGWKSVVWDAASLS
jgi:hypothetical protein